MGKKVGYLPYGEGRRLALRKDFRGRRWWWGGPKTSFPSIRFMAIFFISPGCVCLMSSPFLRSVFLIPGFPLMAYGGRFLRT